MGYRGIHTLCLGSEILHSLVKFLQKHSLAATAQMLALDNHNRRKSFLLWLLKHKRTDHRTETLAVAAFIRRSGLRTRRVLFRPNCSLREKINCVRLFFFKLLGGHQIQIAKGFQPGVKEGKQGWNHRAFTPSLFEKVGFNCLIPKSALISNKQTTSELGPTQKSGLISSDQDSQVAFFHVSFYQS